MTAISVCLATYNGAAFVAEQLRSILDQLTSDDEIIIVDDGSSDDTLDVVNGFEDARIRVYPNEKNVGVNETFARAVALATKPIIFLSDQDDVWTPGRKAIMLKAFSDPRVLVVAGNYQLIDRDGGAIGGTLRGVAQGVARGGGDLGLHRGAAAIVAGGADQAGRERRDLVVHGVQLADLAGVALAEAQRTAACPVAHRPARASVRPDGKRARPGGCQEAVAVQVAADRARGASQKLCGRSALRSRGRVSCRDQRVTSCDATR